MRTSSRRRSLFALVLTAAGAGAIVSPAKATQYDVVSLQEGVVAYGVDHGTVVGIGNDGGSRTAAVWDASHHGATFLPFGEAAYGISGSQIVGQSYAGANGHASIWGPSGQVDLNPLNGAPSAALTTDGTYQGGYVDFDGTDAALWNGTAGSFVNLSNPNWFNSAVASMWDGVQVGYGTTIGPHALLWHGTASSQVVLAGDSEALGISRGQIVGWITLNGQRHAAVWTGQTPASLVDFGTTLHNTQLNGTNGAQQVGYVTDSQQLPPLGPPIDTHPAVWTGTKDSMQYLPLPAGYTNGQAYAIDQDGNIVGGAFPGGATSLSVAVLWVPHRLPGDANFDGKVDFSDLLTIAHNYGKSSTELGWVDGDFNADGSVGFDDLVILARHYGSTAPATSQLAEIDPSFRTDVERAFESVPEPAALTTLLIPAWFVRRRRRPAPP